MLKRLHRGKTHQFSNNYYLGNGITTDLQLSQFMKDTPGFRGVFDRASWFDIDFRPGESAIINLDANWKRNGTHWVAVIISRDGSTIMYKDSFGAPPPEDFHKLHNVIYGTKITQDINAENCGKLSAMFIKKIVNASNDIAKFYEIA